MLYCVAACLQAAPQAQASGYSPKYAPNPGLDSENKAVEYPWPEHYIDPVMKHGLSVVLPRPFRDALKLDAGYDRWQGLPTLKLDYFMPVKAWNDKSIFVAPRLSVTTSKESFSLGLGIRKLVNAETMVGLHAFHDWERPRGTADRSLRQAGIGLEVSALPGMFSDLSMSVNAYIPVNERKSIGRGGTVLVKESFPYGADGRFSFLLPAISDSLDFRLDGRAHTYRAERTDLSGFSASLTMSSRDGMMSASLEKGADQFLGDYYHVAGNLTLAFDWVDLMDGKMPFSAPYPMTSQRFNRRVRDSLYSRVERQHDLPTDRVERHATVTSTVVDDTVSIRGTFPGLPDSLVTVQVAQSPWQDVKEIRTDSSGKCTGKIKLPPGEYRLRLVHKPSGLMTIATMLQILDDQGQAQ